MAKSEEELRQQLRALSRTSKTDFRYPIDAYEDDLIQLIEAHTATVAAEAVEAAKPAVEIAAKIRALNKLIMGAGEYHDDPYEYVIRLKDARQYRSDLMEFDLAEPIFFDKDPVAALNAPQAEKGIE